MEEQLTGVGLVVARPLDSAELLEPLVAHPGERRGERADLVPDLLGRARRPVPAHPPGELDHDRQVVARLARWSERPPDALDPPLRVGDSPLGLGPGGGRRQDDIGQLAGPGQEDVLDDQELEVREEPDRPVLVGLGLDRVLADAVDRGQAAVLHRVEHPGQVEAPPGRHRDAPGPVELRPDLVVLDMLEAGQSIGQGAHVAAALHVVLAAQWADPAAVAADVAGEQGERDQGEDVVHAVVVLGDPKRPAEHRPGRGRVGVGQLADHSGRDARLTLGVVERVGLDPGPVVLDPAGRPGDEPPVLEAGRQDLPADRVGQGDVRADVEPEPAIGPLGRARPARVDRVQLRPVVDALEQVVEEDRVGLAGVRAPQDHQVGVLDLLV